jgi:hypothetical protein
MSYLDLSNALVMLPFSTLQPAIVPESGVGYRLDQLDNMELRLFD